MVEKTRECAHIPGQGEGGCRDGSVFPISNHDAHLPGPSVPPALQYVFRHFSKSVTSREFALV